MTRTHSFAGLLAMALTGALAGAPLVAFAQSNPSSDQIINSLKPGIGLGSTSRGLRPGGPVSPAAPSAPSGVPQSGGAPAAVAHAAPRAPSRPPVAAAAAPVENPSVNLTVEFRSGSADLSPEAIHTLDELGKALASNALSAYHFRIEGHTDTVGSRDQNKELSERRAETVVDYLSTHFNVDRARLQPVGMGEDGLLVATGAQVSEPRNRRVLVVNLGA